MVPEKIAACLSLTGRNTHGALSLSVSYPSRNLFAPWPTFLHYPSPSPFHPFIFVSQASSPLPLSLPLPHFTRFIIISPFVSPLNSQLDGGSDICLSAILCAACNSAESCCFQSFLEIVYTWILIISKYYVEENLCVNETFERSYMIQMIVS